VKFRNARIQTQTVKAKRETDEIGEDDARDGVCELMRDGWSGFFNDSKSTTDQTKMTTVRHPSESALSNFDSTNS